MSPMMLLATLLALSPGHATTHPPAADELIPETPEGWRYERIDFPLSFAPEIDYEGFEELRFAPGMMVADDYDYFSYAFAIRIEEEVEVDLAFVQSFLERYYRGLCRAALEARQAEVDLSDFKVEARSAERGYAATIEMVDAFLTMEPLKLALELDVHPTPRGVDLFAIASPAQESSLIWKELRALAERWRDEQPMPVFFNHLFVVPDADTYAALMESEFLRASFGVSEERKTVRSDVSYAGLYLYGRRTYFEFLSPDFGNTGLSPGDTGLAFGVEGKGETDELVKALGEHDVTAFTRPVTRELDGEQVPWFEMMGVEKPTATSRMTVFSLEYDERFLSTWHNELAPDSGGISREAVLARYAAKLERKPDEALFQDVTAIDLTLDAAELERLLEVCRAFGYELEEADEAWTCHAPQFRLTLKKGETSRGITRFAMTLRRPVEREPLKLGRAVLRFEGSKAYFELP